MNTEQEGNPEESNAETALCFGHSFKIKEVSKRRLQLMQTLENNADVKLDFSEIETIDTAALQILQAYTFEAKKLGITIDWQGPSQAFLRATELIGIRNELGL